MFYFLIFRLDISSIDEELLRCGLRLCNNVFDLHLIFRELVGVPGLAEIPREFDEASGFVHLGGDEESTMITDIVDVVSAVGGLESQTTVTGNVERLVDEVFGKGTSDISSSNHHTDCRL